MKDREGVDWRFSPGPSGWMQKTQRAHTSSRNHQRDPQPLSSSNKVINGTGGGEGWEGKEVPDFYPPVDTRVNVFPGNKQRSSLIRFSSNHEAFIWHCYHGNSLLSYERLAKYEKNLIYMANLNAPVKITSNSLHNHSPFEQAPHERQWTQPSETSLSITSSRNINTSGCTDCTSS